MDAEPGGETLQILRARPLSLSLIICFSRLSAVLGLDHYHHIFNMSNLVIE